MSRANESVFPMLACSQNVASGEMTQFQYCANLTIREHFAGMAMQAILTGAVTRGCPGHEWDDEISQQKAVSVADRLIAELSKVQP